MWPLCTVMAEMGRARRVAALVLPNLHVALCAYATYLLMDDAGTLGWSDLAWLAMKVSVVRNLIITSAPKRGPYFLMFTSNNKTAANNGVYVWASFKPKYHPDKADARKMGAGDLLEILWRMILVNSVCDAMEDFVVMTWIGFAPDAVTHTDMLWRALLFIPHSFAWEVIFDLGFYLAHRLVHANRFLYIFAHKPHHKYQYPNVLAVHQQTLPDVLLNNFAPAVVGAALLPKFTHLQWHLVMAYKLLTEAAGHSGAIAPLSSFPQLVWLPRLLGIDAHIIDHDWHHSNGGVSNFSKRFLLWDKVFGSYRTPPELQYRDKRVL